MRTVRWAHAALLAVVLPACAHGGSNENENPNTTPTNGAVQQRPADTEWVLAQGGEAKTQRLRPVFRVMALPGHWLARAPRWRPKADSEG